MTLIQIHYHFILEHFYLFFRHASAFYMEVREKVIQEFRFKDETQKTLSFVDLKRETTSKPSLVIIIYVIILLSVKEKLVI